MSVLFEILIIFRHKLFVKSIYKDLSKISRTKNFEYNDIETYENILKNIYSLISRYIIDDKKPKESTPNDAFDTALKTPGKGARIALINFILNNRTIKNSFTSKREYKKYRIRLCQIIESIHNLSLVVDDVLDNDNLRRQEPCVHVKYGIDGVNIFVRKWLDLIFYLILDLPIDAVAKKSCLKILEETCIDIICFVEKEIVWEKNEIDVDWHTLKESDIEDIYYQKTVRIFLLGFEFIQESIDVMREKEAFIKIIENLGSYLQRINDLENFNFKRPNYLADIIHKRIILLNFHKLIEDNEKLRELRHKAYIHAAKLEDAFLYGQALIDNQIPQLEINNLKKLRCDIEAEIEKTAPSFLDKIFLKLIFKIYDRKLKTFNL